jgi:hypothetical protein
MVVVGGVPTMALVMSAVGSLLATMILSINAVAMAALVSMALFFVVLPVFEDAPDCSRTTVLRREKSK